MSSCTEMKREDWESTYLKAHVIRVNFSSKHSPHVLCPRWKMKETVGRKSCHAQSIELHHTYWNDTLRRKSEAKNEPKC